MGHRCDPQGGDGVTCIPGCYPQGEQCHEVMRSWSCSYPPERLKAALTAQQGRFSYRSRNNEIVVTAESFSSSLPWSIQAFFYVPGSTGEERDAVYQARTNLIGAYPEQLTEANAPPVIILDMEDGLINTDSMAPFSLPSEG